MKTPAENFFSEPELLHALELEGYDTGYCILDRYTLFHRGDGHRIFPKEVEDIEKQTYPSHVRSCDLNVYTFELKGGKKGVFISDSRGGEAVLGDSFFIKAKRSEA